MTTATPAPGTTHAAQPAEPPDWGLARRILFRASAAYLVLYLLPFPFPCVPVVGGAVAGAYEAAWDALLPAVGARVFGVTVATGMSGSGDRMYHYVQLACQAALAVLAAALWTAIDRRSRGHDRLLTALRVYVRYALGATLMNYGAAKILQSQFPPPSLDRMLQPLGEFSPMGLLWTFMGYSYGYNLFTGLAEFVPGLLLFFRHTALLGACLSAAVLANVVALNFFFDVPVKLYSTHLLLMSGFLILPDAGRLLDVFVLNRPAPAAPRRSLFASRRLDRAGVVARTVLVLGLAGMSLGQTAAMRSGMIGGEPSPLRGIWEVESFARDGEERPPLLSDRPRWRRLVVDRPGMVWVHRMDGLKLFHGFRLGPDGSTLELTSGPPPRPGTGMPEPRAVSTFAVERPGPDRIELDGTHEGKPLRVTLRRVDDGDFLLRKRGFRWVSEYPFNR